MSFPGKICREILEPKECYVKIKKLKKNCEAVENHKKGNNASYRLYNVFELQLKYTMASITVSHLIDCQNGMKKDFPSVKKYVLEK